MSDTVIKAENLGKKYLIGHQSSERYTVLRDVLARSARNALHKTRQLLSGRQLLEGDSVEEFWALQDVNFEIKRGDRVGIIGRNGAGKSTLLKILSRITEPSAGRVEITGRVASLLEVGTGFHPELTGRENIYLNGAILGMTRAEIKRKFDEMVDFAGVEKFLDTPVKRYSSGMYVRLAFSVAAHLEPEILIVDEVLAVGDAEFQKKCLGKMEDVSKGEGRTVLFVSHNMSAINSLCNIGIILENGTLKHVGMIKDILSLYNNNDNRNRKTFDEMLKYVEIEQDKEKLIIKASYKFTTAFEVPHLGFLIKNSIGETLFASNPTLDRVYKNSGPFKNEGYIEINIESPKLADGNYSMSVWFGDGYQDFIHAQDCITFDITGMGEHGALRNNNLGSILPVCKWSFT